MWLRALFVAGTTEMCIHVSFKVSKLRFFEILGLFYFVVYVGRCVRRKAFKLVGLRRPRQYTLIFFSR